MSRVRSLRFVRHSFSHYRDQPGDLTEEGVAVLRDLREWIDHIDPFAPVADQLFVSPAVRARETAEQLFGLEGPVVTREPLRPIWLNEEEQATLRRLHGDRSLDHWTAHINDMPPFQRVNVANYRRVSTFLARVLSQSTPEVVIVGHLETLRSICTFLEVPNSQITVPYPASVTTFDLERRTLRYIDHRRAFEERAF